MRKPHEPPEARFPLSRRRLFEIPVKIAVASGLGSLLQTTFGRALPRLKITDVETWVLHCASLFVIVHTGQGITGYGESSPMNVKAIASLVNEALKPLVIGQEALNRDRVWERICFSTYKLGVMGAQPEAMAGIDIAL